MHIYQANVLESLIDRRKHRRLNLFYSIHNNAAPEYLIDLLPPLVSGVSQYNLRNNDGYVVQQHRLASTSKKISILSDMFGRNLIMDRISFW